MLRGTSCLLILSLVGLAMGQTLEGVFPPISLVSAQTAASKPAVQVLTTYRLVLTEDTSWTGTEKFVDDLRNFKVSSSTLKNIPNEPTRVQLAGKSIFQEDAVWTVQRKIDAGLTSEGLTEWKVDSMRLMQDAKEILDRVASLPEMVLDQMVPPWLTEPDASQSRWYGWRRHEIQITYRVVQDGQNRAEYTTFLSTVWIPFNQPIFEGPIVKLGTEQLLDVKNLSKAAIGELREITILDSAGKILGKDSQRNLKLGVRGAGLNDVVVTVENSGPDPITIIVPAGTAFLSSDPKSQNMMSVVPGGATDPAHEKTELRIRSVCLEIGKDEPTEAVNFSNVPASDQLRRLADYVAGQTMHGPWDQARTWIATDLASLSQVNEHIKPMLTAGGYVKALQEATELGGIQVNSESLKRLLDPKLILGETASAEATAWYLKTLAKVDPSRLKETISTFEKKYKDILSQAKGTEAMLHQVNVSKALLELSNNEIQKRGMDILMKTVPQAKYAELLKSGGLDGAVKLLASKDIDVLDKALDLVKVFQPHMLVKDLLQEHVVGRVQSLLTSIVGGEKSKLGKVIKKAGDLLRKFKL